MKRRRAIILIVVLSVAVLGAAILVVWRYTRPHSHGTEYERQFAMACLQTLRACSDGTEIDDPDDPRLPQILKDLKPTGSMVIPEYSFVLFPGAPNAPLEYHLNRESEKSNEWTLYAVKRDNRGGGHVEVARITSEY